MKDWLLELLECREANVRVSSYDVLTGEIFSAIVFCDGEKFSVRRGILSAIRGRKYREVIRLKGLYESLPEAPWRALENDYVMHMRKAHARLLEVAVDALRRRERLRVLSLGCGWGWEIWALSQIVNAELFVGLDLARKPLKLARRIAISKKRNNVDFIVATVEDLPFKEGTFDLVTGIFGPLDHIRDPLRAFREVRRVLRPGGVFVFTVLNRFSLDWIARVVVNPKLLMKTMKKAREYFTRVTIPLPKGGSVRIPTHYYTPQEVNTLIEKSGFEKVYSLGIFSVLPMNFRRKRFNRLERFLARVELVLRDKPIARSIGRYLGFVVRKK